MGKVDKHMNKIMKYFPLSIFTSLLAMVVSTLFFGNTLVAHIIAIFVLCYATLSVLFFCTSACGIALGFIIVAILSIFKIKVNYS